MTEVKLSVPEDFEEINPEVCSNFDHVIQQDVVDRLMKERVCSRYSGHNFNALVWYQGGQFHAEVWRFRSHVKTVSASTFEEVKDEICNEYGSE